MQKHPSELLCRKGVLRNFAKFTEKHLRQSLSLHKVAGLRSATLLKKRLWHKCFSVNFAKFLRTPFLQNTSRRLLLEIAHSTTHNSKKGGLLYFKFSGLYSVLPIFLTNKKFRVSTFFTFQQNIVKKLNFKKTMKGLYFLLGGRRNVTFSLFL